MPWKNSLQLEREYSDLEFQKAYAEVFTLHCFLSLCLFPSNYKPPDEFGDAISLTPVGAKWVPRIQSAVSDISLSEMNLALFMEFYHHELFIDVTTTKVEVIRKLLDAEIIGGKARYPWVYDRLLYDRFFDMFPKQTERLSHEETLRLLEDTPQGVFQIRDTVVGPFGALSSSCHRLIEPRLRLPLWHCSDPACRALHTVMLSRGRSKVTESVSFIRNEIQKADGPPSEWTEFFLNSVEMADWYDDMHLEHLPWLLVNAFSEGEIKHVLRRLIERHPEEIRKNFPKTKRFKHVLSGSGENISQGLTKSQCFQLILLMPNVSIAECVESLIDDQIIKIPPTETRTPKITYEPYGSLGVICEASRFGIRSVSRRVDMALARFNRLIRELYREQSELEQLKWSLRHIDGDSIYEKLDRYLHAEDPSCVINDLVLSNPENLKQAFRILRYGRFALPASREEEKHLIEKILWKLGFDIGLYPPYLGQFWDRLEKFLTSARTYTVYSENDRESIRSAAANFFVSLEEVLDYSLSFVTWALLSDHYGVTKFTCNFDDARRFMASSLSGRQLVSNEPLNFDPEGKNTLYPLIRGFTILAELCSEILQGKQDKLRRPENELPGYYGRSDLHLFPFLHKVLLLDLRAQDRDSIISLLQKITAKLEKADVCSIRNRIEHRRKDCPIQEEIEIACSAIKEMVNETELAGVCPLICLEAGMTVDEYNRIVMKLKDYRGRIFEVIQPSWSALPVDQPIIVLPCMHVGDSIELVRFKFEETSEYVELWLDYPKSKTRVSPEELEQGCMLEERHGEEQGL